MSGGAAPTPAPRPANAGRALALLLIGVFIGGLGTLVVVQSLNQRTGYADGLMAVLQHEFGQLRRAARGGQCEPARTDRARNRILVLASDIPHAVDAGSSAVQQMSLDLQQAATSSAADCQALARQLQQIDQACKACHTQFR